MNMFDTFLKNIPKDQLRTLVLSHLNTTKQRFAVTFKKKSDGKLRTMVASYGVKQGKGKKKVTDNNVETVYEALRNQFGQFRYRQIRSFDVDSIVSITTNGRTFHF